MYKVFTNLVADEADLYGLVLSASDVTYHVRRGERGWEVYVRDTDYEKALNAIERYLSENPDGHLVEEVHSFEYGRTFSGLWVSLMVVALHVGVDPIENTLIDGYRKAFGFGGVLIEIARLFN